MGKLLFRILFKCVTGAFERWEEFATERIQMREKMEQVMGRLRNRAMAGAFERWTRMAEEAGDMREKLEKAAGPRRCCSPRHRHAF